MDKHLRHIGNGNVIKAASIPSRLIKSTPSKAETYIALCQSFAFGHLNYWNCGPLQSRSIYRKTVIGERGSVMPPAFCTTAPGCTHPSKPIGCLLSTDASKQTTPSWRAITHGQ